MAKAVGAPADPLVARAMRARPDAIGVALTGPHRNKDVAVPISLPAGATASVVADRAS